MTPFNNLEITGGTTTLGVNTTINGTLTVNAGTTLALSTFTLGSPTSVTLQTLGGGTGSTISGSGLFTLGGNVTVNYTGAGAITTGATISCPVALGATRTFTVGDDGTGTNNDLSISGIISTANGIIKAGAGAMSLSGNSTFSGSTTISAGILRLGAAGSGANTPLGTTGAGTSVTSGASLDLAGYTLATAEALTLNGSGISSGGALINSGGACTYSGLITLGSAAEICGGSGTIAVSNVGTITGATFGLTLSGAQGGSIASIIGTTSGTVTKEDAGTWTLSGANTFSGGVTLSAGQLNLNHAQALGTGNFTIAAGTTIDNTTAGAITNSNNNTQSWNGDFTFAGTRNYNIGTGAVTMSANRQVTVTANTLTVGGVININTYNLTKAGGGGLSFGNQALTLNTLTISAGTFTSTSGTLSLSGDFTNNATFTHNSGTVSFDGSATQTVGGSSASTFYNLIFNNDPGVAGDLTFATNNYIVNNQLTMTRGLVNLNGRTITIGTAAGSPGTLSYTAGHMYGGTIRRWINTVTIADGGSAGLFPIGTSAYYRPFYISFPVTPPSTGGTLDVSYTDASTTSVVSVTDGAFTIQVMHDAFWSVTTGNSLTAAASATELRFDVTGIGVIGDINDLRLMWSGTVIGTAGTNGGSVGNPIVRRVAIPAYGPGVAAGTVNLGSKDPIVSPLPVEFLSFNATPNGKVVDVNWSTATEMNSDYFMVQRSQDGISFQDVSQVKAAGNSSTVKNYSTVDTEPYSGISYYRLKQYDLDGKYIFSNIVTVNMNEENVFSIFPNPSEGPFNVGITGTQGEPLKIVIRDLLGKELYSEVIIPANDTSVFSIAPSEKLSSGVYTVIVSSDKVTQTNKLVIK